MVRLRCCIFVFALLIVPSAAARADAVDNYIHTEMKRQGIPGLSLAVVRKGKIIKAQGYGLANVELDMPATEQSVYEIGSLTKPFVATAIMMLVEEGRLNLNDNVSSHLSDLPDAWKGITLWQLLTHTSGLRSYLQRGSYGCDPVAAVLEPAADV